MNKRFADFYQAVYGYEPFPWQERLARRVCAGDWPRVIALPTAAGKTTCIDIAVFALACRAKNAPRRIFFIVDRRIVVDQAQRHAEQLMRALDRAPNGILHEVANSLRALAQDRRPLDVYALRAGMYRETAWVRSPLQPTVIASTVDQVGSRLLFRGYGVSDSMKPIHAGLVGNDSLILLDEAHCARPFDQTMRAVERYREWGERDGRPPFRFVSMTATPGGEVPPDQIERDQADDQAHPVLGRRIAASKPATLVVAGKATGKKWQLELVKELAGQARALAEGGDKAVGIIVNRVATARMLARELGPDVVLLTGRMRPLDRDRVFDERLRPLLSNADGTPPQFVVGTQCLEVGADFDFHALVTECASLDALRQRFGRLNRVARRDQSKAVVVARADQTEDSSDDPVYGASLAETWKWLNERATGEVIDVGIAAMREHTATLTQSDFDRLNAPAQDAPVLFPAHLDCWVQTSPIPTPDPDPALFLHGRQSGIPDVQIVLRADLGDDPTRWAEIVTLCPPSSSETVPVRIDVFRKWLAGQESRDDSSDVEGDSVGDADVEEGIGERRALRWRGPNDRRTAIVSDPTEDVRPNETFVIRAGEAGVGGLGDFLTLPPADYGDLAFQRSRDRAVLRLTPALYSLSDVEELEADDDEFESKLTGVLDSLARDDAPDWQRRAASHLRSVRNRTVEPHPLGGWVVTGRRRLRQFDPEFVEDDESYQSAGQPVTLEAHSRGVTEYARRFAAGCGLSVETYALAGQFHDVGKLDPRFQAMLQNRSPRTAAPPPLAKSGRANMTPREREEARAVHRFPKGGRHELLSAALVATKTDDDLLLHLIATHHGTARPFAGPVEENDFARRPFPAPLFGQTFALDSSAQDPAGWNAILPERFWRIVRKFGWWGAPYREAVFRLADQAESRAEQEDGWKAEEARFDPPGLPPTGPAPMLQPVELSGLDGSNPLAFLAAIGTLRLADQAFSGHAKLSWQRSGGWIPVLHLPSADGLVERLHQLVHRVGNPKAMGAAEALEEEYRKHRKKVETAQKAVKDRKLRGAEREAVIANEVAPLQAEAKQSRAQWLQALEPAVPAPFLSLGKALSVTEDEFRAFAQRMLARLVAEGVSVRSDADFAAAFGCEACILDNGKIAPTEFQLITGSGHQFFLETLSALMQGVTIDQLRRSLFGPWNYSDPRLSFRWDPVDDRRYAYAWDDPSGEQVKTEHGANLLAAFGLPLFPVIPTAWGAETTGFDPWSDPPAFTWPVWTKPLSVDVVRSLVAQSGLQRSSPDRAELMTQGVGDLYRARRIEVGRPPLSKLNLTAAVTV